MAAAPLGDLDGDGRPELAVGAYGDDGGRGAVWVLSLRSDGTVHAARPIRLDSAPGDRFGTSVAALGDLDGDGGADLLLGARLADIRGPTRGAARVLFTGYPVATASRPATFHLTIGPSPAQGPATVRFALAIPGRVEVEVVDMLGRTWATSARNLASGSHRLALDASRWPAGLYVVRLSAAGTSGARALVVVR
ncbi:FG-GAP-like repeat-containing protein [Rubrivirga sp. IMCC43871]|uniref:FG-GAP-like repeat-containing protein n=1 Tax=Rubrivirga sp. IMCC43871 TaxID=3391575 RepID=UPI00398FCBC3